MRYAALFGILGILLAGAAVRSAAGAGAAADWVVIGVEGYFALCLMTMALVYAWNDCGASFTPGSGRSALSRVLSLLLWPYRLLARVTLAVLRPFDSMELLHPVGPRLYVGRRPTRSEQWKLADLGITSVLNLCAEFPQNRGRRATPALETVHMPVLDGTAPSDRQFREAVDWISERHGAGRSILVHCAQGRGRSVIVAAAALCRLGLASDPDDALARIISVRPGANPSRRQRAALVRYWNFGRVDGPLKNHHFSKFPTTS